MIKNSIIIMFFLIIAALVTINYIWIPQKIDIFMMLVLYVLVPLGILYWFFTSKVKKWWDILYNSHGDNVLARIGFVFMGLMGSFFFMAGFGWIQEGIGWFNLSGTKVEEYITTFIVGLPLIFALWLLRTRDSLKSSNENNYFNALNLLSKKEDYQSKSIGFKILMDLRIKGLYYTEIQSVLQGLNLANVNANEIEIKDIIFYNINFSDTVFMRSRLENVKFVGCNLTNVDFRSSYLKGVQFAHSNLAKVDLRNQFTSEAELHNNRIYDFGESDHDLKISFDNCNNQTTLKSDESSFS